MPLPGLTIQVPTRYPPWVNLSLSVYQGPSPEKSRRRSVKITERPNGGGGGLLRQSNQKCTYKQAPSSIRSVCAVPYGCTPSTCAVSFTRPSDTTRLLARLVRPRHPLGHRLLTITQSFRPSGASEANCCALYVRVRKKTHPQITTPNQTAPADLPALG